LQLFDKQVATTIDSRGQRLHDYQTCPSPDLAAACEGNSPVLFVDSEGKTTHVVLPVDEARRLLDEHYRRELDVAFKQADAGQIEPWDIEATLQKAH